MIVPMHADVSCWIVSLAKKYVLTSVDDSTLRELCTRLRSFPAQSQIAFMAFLAPFTPLPDRVGILDALQERLVTLSTENPKVAASAAFSLICACHATQLADPRFLNGKSEGDVANSLGIKPCAEKILNDAATPLLVKIAVSFLVIIRFESHANAISALVDLVADPRAMTKAWEQSGPGVNPWVLDGWGRRPRRTVTLPRPDVVAWNTVAASYLDNVPDNVKFDIIVNPLLRQLAAKTDATEPFRAGVVDAIFSVQLNEPLAAGIYFEELSKDLQDTLRSAEVSLRGGEEAEAVWESLRSYHLPASSAGLAEFIAKKKPSDLPEKRFPTFDTLWDVDWLKLQGAYGVDPNVPKHIKHLACRAPDLRQNGQGVFDAHIIHQGTIYSVTPHFVRHAAALLEYSSVKGKSDLIARLLIYAVKEPQMFLNYRRFERRFLDPFEDDRDVYDAVRMAVPHFIHLLEDVSAGFKTRCTAAFALAFFPEIDDPYRAVSALEAVVYNPKNPVQLIAAAVTSLGMLLADSNFADSIAKLRATCVNLFRALQNSEALPSELFLATYYFSAFSRLLPEAEALPAETARALLLLVDKADLITLPEADDLYFKLEQLKQNAYFRMMNTDQSGELWEDEEGFTDTSFSFPWTSPRGIINSIVDVRRKDLTGPMLDKLDAEENPGALRCPCSHFPLTDL